MARIKTRILILSDTHAHLPTPTPADDDLTASSDYAVAVTGYRAPLPAADVALHCGDLTTDSAPAEYARTVSMLRALRAPLKIVIPGNHDRALDGPFWSRHGHAYPEDREEALQLLADAKEDGVVYLGEQGTHRFALTNGAVLNIYTSPYTPEYGVWGFQYSPDEGHDFAIPPGMDIAMTHGPPHSILDLAGFPSHNIPYRPAGCPDLLAAVSRARPRIHCFGHIHESWGAHLATWKPDASLTAEEAIDAEASRSIVALEEIKPMSTLDPPATEAQAARLMEWSRKQGVNIDLEEELQGEDGQETLFINAAIQGYMMEPSQLPFVVDMMLDAGEQQ